MSSTSQIEIPPSQKLYFRAAILACAVLLAVGLFARSPGGIEANRRPSAIEQSQVAATKAATTDRQRYLCRQADICRRYGTARQDCAVAGDFKNCVSVKMKGEYGGFCTDDGRLPYAAPELPNRVECALLDLGL